MIRLKSLRAQVYRHPLEEPVVVSFGRMFERVMVLVRAEDMQGAVGWGEIWCNFPSAGAEHRSRLVESVLAPLAMERSFDDPSQAYKWLTERTSVLALQSGEHGPLAQAIAGIDIALWDLAAREVGMPLWLFLGGRSPAVPVYASGLNPDRPEVLAATRRRQGYTAFKVKIGFGESRDLSNLSALRSVLGRDCCLMADVNQGWTFEQAAQMVPKIKEFGLDWLEEPLRVDRPWSEWIALSADSPPLAAGENLIGEDAFNAAADSGAVRILQPDVAKWGGFSGCLPVARGVLARGLRYCPHYLGGGIGLLASAHLLAAAGGDGLLEVDANPNPLRELIWGSIGEVNGGRIVLDSSPGLGREPDIVALARFSSNR